MLLEVRHVVVRNGTVFMASVVQAYLSYVCYFQMLTFAALASHLMTCFPVLATGHMFSHPCNWLHVFLHL